MVRAVTDAISLGCRHLDCASVNGNEAATGRRLTDPLAGGKVTRDGLWITSRLWNDLPGPGDVGPVVPADTRRPATAG